MKKIEKKWEKMRKSEKKWEKMRRILTAEVAESAEGNWPRRHEEKSTTNGYELTRISFWPQSSSPFAKASAGQAENTEFLASFVFSAEVCSQSKLLPQSVAFVHRRLSHHSFALSWPNSYVVGWGLRGDRSWRIRGFWVVCWQHVVRDPWHVTRLTKLFGGD